MNPGRKGIPLSKLSKQAESIELFLRSLASDLGEDGSTQLWLATDFRNGSVINTAEYQAVVDVDQAVQLNVAVLALAKFRTLDSVPSFVSPATLDRFASLRGGLDDGENLGIAVFDPETGKAQRWQYVDKLKFAEIGDAIDAEVRYVGSVMGTTHEWNKGADRPYLIIRDLASGELVKCTYSDADYPKVSNIFTRKSAVVVIEGAILFNRITGRSEVTAATGFEFAPDFSDADFEAFFGCAPDLTGDLGTDDFIAKGRADE
ncbi:MAG: hypothetical protein V4750_02035 [Pseudomonadota bacterium]